jgi:hypothetical protein
VSKILNNTTASPVFVSDTGVSIAANGSYTIPEQDYLLWAASSNIVSLVGAATVTVSDGSYVLSISDGINLIKGIYPSLIKAVPYGNTNLQFAEVASVAASTPTDVISFTASANTRLVTASVSGNNVAMYTLLINGVVKGRKYTSFGASLNTEFKLNTGLSVVSGDIVKIQVYHTRPFVGDFNAKLILENT